MKVTNLESTLLSFIKDDLSRALLIDGQWGCGKTYQFMNFLKKYNKKTFKDKKIPIYYVSLFGIKSLEEINSLLYNKINYLKKITISVVKFLSRLFITNNKRQEKLVDELSWQLNNISERPKIRKEVCIVFDDLERLGEKVGYVELFGYLNEVLKSNTKFICICDTSKIGLYKQNDIHRKEDFDNFKEKIFDRIIYINEQPLEIISSLFEPYHINGCEKLLGLFGNNIRNIKKTIQLFNDAKKHLNDKNIQTDDYSLLLSSINVIKIIFDKHDEVEFNDDKGFAKMIYNDNVQKYGLEIANGIEIVKKENKIIYLDNRDNYFMPLLDAYYFNDYTQLDELLSSKTNDKSIKVDRCLFYLSDEDNIKFSKTFINDILSDNFELNKNFYNKLIELCQYSILSIKESTIDEICNSIMSKAKIEDIPMERFEAALNSDYNDNECLQYLYNKLNECISFNKEKNILESFFDSVKNSNYDYTLKILEENYYKDDFKNNKNIINFIKKNHYLLPNFKNSFDEYIWHVCHAICDCLVKMGMKEELYNYFLDEALRNKENQTYLKKLEALCTYRLEKRSDFIQYIDSIKK